VTAPERRFHETVAQLVHPERLPRLTQEMAEVLAVVIMDGMATRRRIEEVRGAASLSIGSDGPVTLPRDSSETLALLVSRGLLSVERDDHATGRPLVYRPAAIAPGAEGGDPGGSEGKGSSGLTTAVVIGGWRHGPSISRGWSVDLIQRGAGHSEPLATSSTRDSPFTLSGPSSVPFFSRLKD
jgi:hypothetical protein